MMCQLFDVVYQTVKLPLRVHLRPPSEREAVELFVVPQITEYRLHCGEALAVFDAPLRTVNAHFHFVNVTFSVFLALEERHLPDLGFLWRKQTTISVRTR